jgi:hypothetical protein
VVIGYGCDGADDGVELDDEFGDRGEWDGCCEGESGMWSIIVKEGGQERLTSVDG